MPKITLAMDAALGACSVALVGSDQATLAAETRMMDRGHSEILVPMIQDNIKKAGIGFADIGHIVCTVGPGGFTGVRIGLSTARSLAMALDCSVEGVWTTDSIAQKIYMLNKGLKADLIVILETKRSDFYYACYKGPLSEMPGLINHEDFYQRFSGKTVMLAGDGVGRLQSMLAERWSASWSVQQGYDVPDPVMVAACARNPATRRAQEPLYIRGADVSQAKSTPRVVDEM